MIGFGFGSDKHGFVVVVSLYRFPYQGSTQLQ